MQEKDTFPLIIILLNGQNDYIHHHLAINAMNEDNTDVIRWRRKQT